MPTGRNVHSIPKLSLHNGKELAQQVPSWRQPTWWFADGSPLRLLEWELQGGVQWLEAVLQRILLVEFYKLLQRKQQDRCSLRGPAHNGDTAGRSHIQLLMWNRSSFWPPWQKTPWMLPTMGSSLSSWSARTILWWRNHIVSRQFS